MSDLETIVARLEPTLGAADGVPEPLEGGITNRNFRARLGDREYVIRVPGKDTNLLEIDRGTEIAANTQAADLGIAPPVAASLDDPMCIVTSFIEGTGMEPEGLREPDAMGQIARGLRAFHDSGLELSTDFNSFRIVETYAATATERGAQVPPDYEEAHTHADEIAAALTGPEHEPAPCHDDLLAANFIHGGDGRIWIVDWEYAGMGDRYFDLANFAVNNKLDEAQQDALLAAYFGEAATERQIATLRLMKFMSDFREAMWGVVQTAVSELDVDFPDYAAKHFKRMHETAADPGFARSLQEARAATP